MPTNTYAATVFSFRIATIRVLLLAIIRSHQQGVKRGMGGFDGLDHILVLHGGCLGRRRELCHLAEEAPATLPYHFRRNSASTARKARPPGGLTTGLSSGSVSKSPMWQIRPASNVTPIIAMTAIASPSPNDIISPE
jgi:hypothetical protein